MLDVLFATCTKCAQLVNGVSGKMANGRPLLVCFGEPPGMYKLAPDPDFSAPETVSSHTMASTGYAQDPQPAHVSKNGTAATGPVVEPVAQSFLGSNIARSAAVTAAAAEQLSRVRAQHAVSGSAALSAASPAGTASSPAATAAASIHGVAPSARAFPPSTVFGVFGSGQTVNAPEAPYNMSARLAPGQGAARPDALRQERPVTAPDARPGAVQAPKLASVGFQDPAAPLPPILVAALAQINAGKAAGKKPLVTSPLCTIASPADPASSMAIRQHDTQSQKLWDTQSLEVDLIPQQVSAHQVSADQAELGGSPQAAVSHQQAGTPSGTRRNNKQQSSGKRGRHRFRVNSESDEEPAEPKKVCLDSRRKEIVAPFSLRSSRKGPDDAEQGTFFHHSSIQMGCCLKRFGLFMLQNNADMLSGDMLGPVRNGACMPL